VSDKGGGRKSSRSRETRGSSVDIWLPELQATAVGDWRTATVGESMMGVAPHISLMYPWLPPADLSVGVERLALAIADVSAFAIEVDTVGTFAEVVWIAPKRAREFRILMEKIAKAFPECSAYEGRVEVPQPHITVALAGSRDETPLLKNRVERWLDACGPIRLSVVEVSVVAQDDQGRSQYHQLRLLG
jgi:2'-5' RNA ligase